MAEVQVKFRRDEIWPVGIQRLANTFMHRIGKPDPRVISEKSENPCLVNPAPIKKIFDPYNVGGNVPAREGIQEDIPGILAIEDLIGVDIQNPVIPRLFNGEMLGLGKIIIPWNLKNPAAIFSGDV